MSESQKAVEEVVEDAAKAVEENAEAQKEVAVAETAAITVAAATGAVELSKQTTAAAELEAAEKIEKERLKWEENHNLLQEANSKATAALEANQTLTNQVAALAAANQQTLEALQLLTPPPSPTSQEQPIVNPQNEDAADLPKTEEQNQPAVKRKTRSWI